MRLVQRASELRADADARASAERIPPGRPNTTTWVVSTRLSEVGRPGPVKLVRPDHGLCDTWLTTT